MKVRIKFKKFGAMKFIGHLDVMRYFQKAFRRGKIDIEYSKGFSPHQIMSFAAPLGVGLTSDGEYLDASLLSCEEPAKMIDRINGVLTEGFLVTGFHILDEQVPGQKVVTAMSLVSAADYLVSFKDGYSLGEHMPTKEAFQEKFLEFYQRNEIIIDKETKKSVQAVDIKPLISFVAFDETEYQDKLMQELKELPNQEDNSLRNVFTAANEERSAEQYDNGIQVYMQVATGSANNLKPELVMEAFYQFLSLPFNKFAWQVHRLEVYTREEETGKLIALEQVEK